MLSFTAAEDKPPLLAGIDFCMVHFSLTGSYTSLPSTFVNIPPVLPPITYNFPLITADVRCSLAVFIGSFSVHVLLFGSYAMLLVNVCKISTPPTTYRVPLIKLALNAPRGLGRFAPSVHLLVIRSYISTVLVLRPLSPNPPIM